ncbi:TIGR02281 family clan AA aspartic protease [Draconibacterium sp.]|uniref:retropepsin-like aspartic protease family protein n=1 Tax=Draconibacterium sp. TaxID=1965318 RepID=UPI003568F961
MKKLFSTLFFVFTALFLFAQVGIKMTEENGVYTMPCTVNGLKLRFIFDTGASNISLSLTEAAFMLKNGYLEENDFTGTSLYSDANGNISEGMTVNLKKIEISGIELHDVKANIVTKIDAPLLLGQSALSRLGEIQFDYSNNVLKIERGNTELYQQPNPISYYHFKMLPRGEQAALVYGNKMATIEYAKYLRQRRTGIIITSVGVAAIGTGIVFDMVQNREENWDNMEYYNDTGGYIAAIGGTVAVAGLVTWLLAPKKMRNAVYYYNKGEPVSLEIQPSLNSVGLVMRF